MRLEIIARLPESRTKSSPIIFVHGFWQGARCWEEHFLPCFAQRGYACFAPNLRGYGGSEGAERLRWTSLADIRKVRPTPMLVLGADDFMVRARQVKATARAYGIEAQIFPDMRHAMMLDVGWHNVADRIAEWVDRQAL